jgi:SAM-dependent methyltransferase
MRTGLKFLDKTVKATELEQVAGDYRNSFVHEGLASRNRAMVVELLRAFMGKKIGPKKIRMYAPGARSGLTRLLAKHFPKLQTSGYLRCQQQGKESATPDQQDLAALTYKDASFDYVIMDDVFQNVPNLDKVLSEVHRVLAPSGVLFATFPFAIDSEEHLIQATRNIDGSIDYPVSQGNQQDPTDEQRAVVFQIPGWNILKDCRNTGFIRAEFVFLCSPTRGMLASDVSGVIILTAQKSA